MSRGNFGATARARFAACAIAFVFAPAALLGWAGPANAGYLACPSSLDTNASTTPAPAGWAVGNNVLNYPFQAAYINIDTVTTSGGSSTSYTNLICEYGFGASVPPWSLYRYVPLNSCGLSATGKGFDCPPIPASATSTGSGTSTYKPGMAGLMPWSCPVPGHPKAFHVVFASPTHPPQADCHPAQLNQVSGSAGTPK